MRFDDPARPQREGVKLQLSGAPLPVVTLIAPEAAGAASASWLACIHAARGGNRFGYHSAVLPDLAAFSEAYLADPEACLASYFGYLGPEEEEKPANVARSTPALPDLWED